MNLSGVPLPQHDRERQAVKRVIAWAADNSWADAIVPERLAKDAREITLADLLRALMYLQAKGIVEIRYRPVSPITHQIVSRDFDSPVQLRSEMQLEDASANVFDGWDADFVQVYVPTDKWR